VKREISVAVITKIVWFFGNINIGSYVVGNSESELYIEAPVSLSQGAHRIEGSKSKPGTMQLTLSQPMLRI